MALLTKTFCHDFSITCIKTDYIITLNIIHLMVITGPQSPSPVTSQGLSSLMKSIISPNVSQQLSKVQREAARDGQERGGYLLKYGDGGWGVGRGGQWVILTRVFQIQA